MKQEDKEAAAPRFLCDVMLGRLARWLRLAGYDTVYHNTVSDEALVAQAKKEGRILLTRDTRIHPRDGVRIFGIHRHDLRGQLRQVLEEFTLSPHPGRLRRCSLCNSLLRRIHAARAEGKVPEYIRHRHQAFSYCPGCAKIYWSGSHQREISRTLDLFLGGGGPST